MGKCKGCGARDRTNYPHGRQSKGRTTIDHIDGCKRAKHGTE